MYPCVAIFFIQVEQNRVKLLNDRAVAKSQLQKKLGQLLYLNNLEKVNICCIPESVIHQSSEMLLTVFNFYLKTNKMLRETPLTKD